MATPDVMLPVSEKETLPPGKPGRRWIPWMLMLVFAVIAALGWRAAVRRSQEEEALRAEQARKAALRPIPVSVGKVTKRNFPVFLTGLGSVTAYNTVTIQTRVDGQIIQVLFQEGQRVKAGQKLVEIDPRPYQVQLQQAQGQLSRDQAQLHDVLLDAARYKALYASQVISRQQLDTQQSLADQLNGAIQADKAQIANAQLNLSYCQITAPISGRIGLRLVDSGNIVHATDTSGLLVITEMQPIAVIFTLPEDQLAPILRGLRRGQVFQVDAYDRTDTKKIASGRLLATDNRIDPATGTLRLKAVFSNQDEALFPDQFVNIHIMTEVLHNALLIPAAALQHGTRGDYVFVAQPNGTVTERPIQIEMTQGNVAVIRSGLSDGETVVTDGQDKLRNGSRVNLMSSQSAGEQSS